MRIVTGLEIVQEQISDKKQKGYLQDAIDYIISLQNEIDKLEDNEFDLKQKVEHLENKYENNDKDLSRY